jgi:pimeloyl-ACP methyl ester carboxylesterase
MTTQFLEHQNGQIAYDDAGSGPLVVCVPSMGDVRAEYRFLAPKLADAGYRVVTMDVRGHGESSTVWDDFSVAGVGSDIVALIRKLGAGPAVVVGESMAAGAAVWAAAEAPELVAGLILAGPFVRSEPSFINGLLFAALFSRPWGPTAWTWYYGTLYPAHKPHDFAEYVDNLRKNLAQPGRMEALQKMLTASKSASEQRLPAVQAPAMVLMGTKDPDFKDPGKEAHWVAERLNATVHMVEGAGHYPQTEMPDAVAPLMLDFLAQHHPVREALRGA